MHKNNGQQANWKAPEIVNYGDVETLTAKGAGGGDGISMHSGFSAQGETGEEESWS